MIAYKDQLQIYTNRGQCYCGRFNEFTQYIAEYAKDRKGHGLDLGGGPNGFNSQFFNSVERLDGCDAEKEVVDSFPPKYTKKFTYKLGSEEKLPYNDGQLDFLVCSCVVQHLQSMGELKVGLMEMSRVIKKGGSMFFLYKAGSNDTVLTHYNETYKGYRTLRVFNPTIVSELLSENGLSIDSEEKLVDNNWIPYSCCILTKMN